MPVLMSRKKKGHTVYLFNLQPHFNLKLSLKSAVFQCEWVNPSLSHTHQHHHRSRPYTKQQLVLLLRSAHPIGGTAVPVINGLHTHTCSVTMQVINMCSSYCDFVLFYTVPLVEHVHKHACVHVHTRAREIVNISSNYFLN